MGSVTVDHSKDRDLELWKCNARSFSDTAPVTGKISSINQLTRGFLEDNRISRVIRIKRLQIAYTLCPYTTGTVTALAGDTIAVMIIWDKMGGDQTPVWTSIFGDNPLSISNLYPERYEILHHRLYAMGPFTIAGGALTGGSSHLCYTHAESIDMDHTTIFNSSSTGVVGNIKSGTLYWGYCAQEQASTGAYVIRGTATFFWEDV